MDLSCYEIGCKKCNKNNNNHINCEKVYNEVRKKCKQKVCYGNCNSYKQNYLDAVKNKKSAQKINIARIKLNNCYRIKIESSSGTDGWGATPAQPTLDNMMGFGLYQR